MPFDLMGVKVNRMVRSQGCVTLVRHGSELRHPTFLSVGIERSWSAADMTLIALTSGLLFLGRAERGTGVTRYSEFSKHSLVHATNCDSPEARVCLSCGRCPPLLLNRLKYT